MLNKVVLGSLIFILSFMPKPIKHELPKKIETLKVQKPIKKEKPLISKETFKRDGVKYWNNWRWTWYSEKVLPGGGLQIPNRHIEDDYVCDKDSNIVLASVNLPKGTIVKTPFGKKGKVYDNGCSSGTLDVYVSW